MSKTGPKSVLIVHSGGGIGGAPISLLNMAAGLDPERYVPKIAFSAPGPMLQITEDAGVAAIVAQVGLALPYGAHVPLRPRTLVPALLGLRRTGAAGRALVRLERPDIVHLNTSALVPLGMGLRSMGVPIVWHVREVVNPGTAVGRLMAKIIVDIADRVIAVSEYVASGLPSRGNVTVVYNSVDTHRFDPARVDGSEVRVRHGIDGSATVVGILGSVQEPNGHFVLAAAARRLLTIDPDMVFMVVGGGAPAGYGRTWKGRLKRAVGAPLDNEEKLRRTIAGSGSTNSFRFCGYRADVAPYVAAMDIVVAPALLPEGCPRPLLEGMAMARPVVATDIGPSSEILGEGTGLLCRPGSADSLADAIERLASDSELRRGLGSTGRSRAVERFNVARHTQAVARVYDSLWPATAAGR